MKHLFLALSFILAAGCQSASEGGRDISEELVYFKDYRTDLCYAFHQTTGGYDARVLANVPCSEKVERLLVNK